MNVKLAKQLRREVKQKMAERLSKTLDKEISVRDKNLVCPTKAARKYVAGEKEDPRTGKLVSVPRTKVLEGGSVRAEYKRLKRLAKGAEF